MKKVEEKQVHYLNYCKHHLLENIPESKSLVPQLHIVVLVNVEQSVNLSNWKHGSLKNNAK
jgi:hypothetical protein